LNLIIENDKFLTQEEITKIQKPLFRQYAEKIFANQNHASEPSEAIIFKNTAFIYLADLDVGERNLFIAKNLITNSPIETSNKIHFKNKCKFLPCIFYAILPFLNFLNFQDYTVCDERSMQKKTQNYTICFSENNLRVFGLIRKIYKINENIFFLIQHFLKSKNFSQVSVEIEEKLNEFFIISCLSQTYSLINIQDVHEKCILLNNNDEYFISIIHCEKDHN
jgi:hypothetical protein